MKKRVIAIVAVSFVLAVGGIVSLVGIGDSSKAMEYIGVDMAREIAISNSGTESASIQEYSIEMDRRNGRDYYDVEFKVGGIEYSYDIDALTGAIISARPASIKDLTPQEQPAAGTDQQTPGEAVNNDTTYVKPSTQTQQTTQSPQAPIQSSAQNQTEAQSPQAPAQQTQQATQATPAPQVAPAPQQPASPGIISESQAKQSVLSRVPGATMANFHEFHLDSDDGRYEYEGELFYNGMEYSFEIDAYSGQFRDWDVEPIDD